MRRLGMDCPVIQAPMAGVSTPALAAAVSNAGGLGSLGLGAMTAPDAQAAIARTRALTARSFGVNVFCHAPARRDPVAESAWLDHLRPHFAAVGATPPATLREIYASFLLDDAMQRLLIGMRPAVISFHFGLPPLSVIADLRRSGAVLMGGATSRAEAEMVQNAGLDAVIAQGWQAGGHRGVFDPQADDARLATLDLLAELRGLRLPVIAAGGIMSATQTRAALAAGAVAVQCGTAFLATPEAATSPAHRAALAGGDTVMTRAISGRGARCLRNRFTGIDGAGAPDYPVAYDAGKALNARALAAGQAGYGAHWAGTGAAQARALPAAQVVAWLAGQGDATGAQGSPNPAP